MTIFSCTFGEKDSQALSSKLNRTAVALCRASTLFSEVQEPETYVVFMVTMLGEVPDRATAIREVARILRPGGRFSSTEATGDPDRVKRTELDAFAALAGLEKGESWSGLLVKTFNYNKPRSLA